MLDPFYRQDVFFFVTTIAIVVLTLLLAILIMYVIKITRDVSYISKKAKGQADLISEDLSELRQNVKDQGLKLKHVVGFFNKLRKKK